MTGKKLIAALMLAGLSVLGAACADDTGDGDVIEENGGIEEGVEDLEENDPGEAAEDAEEGEDALDDLEDAVDGEPGTEQTP